MLFICVIRQEVKCSEGRKFWKIPQVQAGSKGDLVMIWKEKHWEQTPTEQRLCQIISQALLCTAETRELGSLA